MPRPATATIFGVLNIIFGATGLFRCVRSLVTACLAHSTSLNKLHSFWGELEAGMWVGFILNCLLCAGGIGLLKFKNWGRNISVAYAVCGILVGSFVIVMSVLVIMPMATEMARHGQADEALTAKTSFYNALFNGVYTLIYPAILFFFAMRLNFTPLLAPTSPASPAA